MLATSRRERLIRRYAAPHTFSMGPDVASVGAAIASAKIHLTPELAERRNRLRGIVAEFDRHLSTEHSDSCLPIRMVTIGGEKAAIDCAEHVLSHGHYVVPAIFPGVPKSQAAPRVRLTADYHAHEIEGLCAAIKSSMKQYL